VRRAGLTLALYAAFLLAKGAFYNVRHFEIKSVTIESKKIPPAFDGYRMALFSDIHLGNLTRQESFLKKFVIQIKQLQPDIIFHAGDLINMYAAEITPKVQAILSQLQAPNGVYSILGNHDMGAYFGKRSEKIGLTPLENTRLVLLRQQEMGWNVLQNESLYIHRESDSIGLCGVPYPPLPPLFSDSLTNFDLRLATRLLDSAQFTIMLCHTPKVWEMMRDTLPLKWVELMLCGHTHAMQAKVKIGTRQWSPAKWMYPYWSGLYERDGHYLYVNEGLGYVLYPMRIGTKPEITLITLQRKK
jgi:predicted MPP superfamily phosphohydrolase